MVSITYSLTLTISTIASFYHQTVFQPFIFKHIQNTPIQFVVTFLLLLLILLHNSRCYTFSRSHSYPSTSMSPNILVSNSPCDPDPIEHDLKAEVVGKLAEMRQD
ncbi:hypothetical protein O181_029630 [Austropuccinia psidii MF-1]|uniref:Transmembrane protein n=1 Tax=Austropuccinia psidii MF-1 TaxID=1389203 RepID=A0A9Q3CUS5_9BASI|nr:hypothetical protein [Austropuccinia psidii MF-1]